jgi:hypothetical protein
MNRFEIESVLNQLHNQGKIHKGSYDLLIKKARTGYTQSLKTFQRMLPILAKAKAKAKKR